MTTYEREIVECLYWMLDDRERPADSNYRAVIYRRLQEGDLFLGLCGDRLAALFWILPGPWGDVQQLTPYITTGTNANIFANFLKEVSAYCFNKGALKLQCKIPLTVPDMDVRPMMEAGYEVAGRLRADYLLGGALGDMLLFESLNPEKAPNVQQPQQHDESGLVSADEPAAEPARAAKRSLWRRFTDACAGILQRRRISAAANAADATASERAD